MSAYLLKIVGIVLISSVLTAILPNGKTSGVIKGVAKLLCLVVIVSPIMQALRVFHSNEKDGQENYFSQSVIKTDESFIQYYSETRILETEQALQKELNRQFNVESRVALEWESMQNEGIVKLKITKIHVQITAEIDDAKKEEIRAYLEKTYCSEVLVE